jgi:RNA polymerase sigma-70 factor (ECF subfamily)
MYPSWCTHHPQGSRGTTEGGDGLDIGFDEVPPQGRTSRGRLRPVENGVHMGVSALSGGVVVGWTEFGELYRGVAPRLAVFAMTLGADRDRAADLAQESLVALWRRWDDVPGTPRTFAHILTVRADREPVDDATAPDGPLRFPLAPQHDAVLAGLAQLAPQERQTLAATFDELPPEDVAQVLRMRVDAVAPTVDAAREALERLLDGQQAQPAYDALVADVASGMDLEAGLALVRAAAPQDDAASDGDAAPEAPARRPAAQVPEQLVIDAMTGDRDAVARLLELIRPLVARYCRGKLGPVDRSFLSADDVAQEVCLAVLGALPNYRVQGRPFLAFVYGIAAHKVIDAHRAVSRGRTDPVADVPDVVAGEAGPEQHALRGELSTQLRALLAELPEKQREILVLRIVVGLSAEETAEIVGASAGAVRVAQHRALTRLRKTAPRSLVQDQT